VETNRRLETNRPAAVERQPAAAGARRPSRQDEVRSGPRQLASEPDGGANALGGRECLDAGLLPWLEAPEVAHVLALQLQRGATLRRQPQLAPPARSGSRRRAGCFRMLDERDKPRERLADGAEGANDDLQFLADGWTLTVRQRSLLLSDNMIHRNGPELFDDWTVRLLTVQRLKETIVR
jgi:hypothetical protein